MPSSSVARYWKEPLDPARHADHFNPGSARPRSGDRRGACFSYFVQVAGFTFEFASVDQLRECLTFFEQRIHPSSRKPVFAPEKGHWQAWHERLPARVLKSSRRERVLLALRAALVSFGV
jgi:hypothetical protein